MDIKSADLVKIIEACGKTGVSQIKMGEVEISFNGFVFQTENDYPKNVEQPGELQTIDPNFELQQKVERVDEEVELMMLTNPAEYEEMLLQGQFEESNSSNME